MIKSCCFIGHRNITITNDLKQKLKNFIRYLIVVHNVTIFLFGSRSKFDELCHIIVSTLKEEYPNIKRIAYTCKSETCLLENERHNNKQIYYQLKQEYNPLLEVDEEKEYKTKYTSGKASYIERNQEMINDSDYCIFFYDDNYLPEIRKYSKHSIGYYQPKSGTELAYTYAKQKKKNIINCACFQESKHNTSYK